MPSTSLIFDKILKEIQNIKKEVKERRLFMLYVSITLYLIVFIEKLLVVLRDGRTIIGFLRSIDQFGKKKHYCNEPVSICIILFLMFAQAN